MANLSFSTVRTNAYTELYNLLQTGTYAISTNNIHPSYNNKQVIKEGYPQLIIYEPEIATTRLGLAPVTALHTFDIRFVIEVIHNSAANAKTIADEVINKILSGRVVLSAAGIREINFEFDSIEVIEWKQYQSNHHYRLNMNARYIVKQS